MVYDFSPFRKTIDVFHLAFKRRKRKWLKMFYAKWKIAYFGITEINAVLMPFMLLVMSVMRLRTPRKRIAIPFVRAILNKKRRSFPGSPF